MKSRIYTRETVNNSMTHDNTANLGQLCFAGGFRIEKIDSRSIGLGCPVRVMVGKAEHFNT